MKPNKLDLSWIASRYRRVMDLSPGDITLLGMRPWLLYVLIGACTLTVTYGI